MANYRVIDQFDFNGNDIHVIQGTRTGAHKHGDLSHRYRLLAGKANLVCGNELKELELYRMSEPVRPGFQHHIESVDDTGFVVEVYTNGKLDPNDLEEQKRYTERLAKVMNGHGL